ncbi:hypothetical protein TL16_g00390 [Triparma laevis f. inornata]|uniref:Cyclic nucleotide-binding domain-containing protein n=2 Tax=Triparma laevis TaxID=1534972 RepID=A0A9W7KVB4_9STRA|nr:hypothetical protein TL16_g00390 [Triparma laevis f. inornata]GMI12620.1 hypothetical protein TrLO_g13017 [Triparma laevis f. longispina]
MQLLILGLILGLGAKEDMNWWGSETSALHKSVNVLSGLDAHLMLHIFLPPLIFESAASLEWHLFDKAKTYIFVLACPGLLLATFMSSSVLNTLHRTTTLSAVAGTCAMAAPAIWPETAGTLIGVILSATDPVAVVALLKELGVKPSLSTSIEGESLFNDGTALVIFLIVIGLVDGTALELTFVDYLSKFLVMSLGGMIWGFLFGFIVVSWLGVIFNDALSEITITMSSAYLCFYIAERFFGISGVIAVVCFGLYFGSTGRTRVSPEVAHFLEEFWELLAFFGNTLIFVIAGIVIGKDVDTSLLTGTNVLYLLLVYLAVTCIRGFVVGCTYYTLTKFGFPLEKSDQIIAWWGGLRGAVGLALAMMVFSNDCIPKEIRDYTLFYTSGIVILTVCVNSLSMPHLVSHLQMDRVASSRQMVFDQAMRNLRAAGDKQEAILRSDHVFDSAVWDEVRKYYFVVPKSKQAIETHVKNTSDKQKLEAKEARRRVLMICKKSYWKQFQDGLLGQHAVKYLMHHTDLAIDNECSLSEWEHYIKLLTFNSSINNERKEEQGAELDQKSKRRRMLLKKLDSVLTICLILILVIIACAWSILEPESESTSNKMTSYRIFEYVSTAIFCVELAVRMYCLGDMHSFFADPYTMMDAFVVFLDLLLLAAGDVLGEVSGFTKSLRIIRFLRLIRLFRIARLAKKIKDTNLEAVNDTKSLWDKSEGIAKNYKRRILYNQLQHGYDVASGFKIAREEALDLLSGLLGSATRFQAIRDEIEEDLKGVRSSLLDMQRLYSEIASSITTAIAARTVLNKQRHAIHDLFHEGMLDKMEMEKMIGSVEYQMKRLHYQPPVITMPAKVDLLKQIPWLECLSEAELLTVVDNFQDSVFTRGDVLMRQDETDDTVYVLARGTVVVELETQLGEKIELDELGMGSVFGEIAWALKSKRGASIIATSPGLLFKIDGNILRDLAQRNKMLSDRLWDTCGRRLSENMLANQLEHHGKSRRQIRDIVHNMELFTVKPDKKQIEFKSKAHVILLQGVAMQSNPMTGQAEMVEAPSIVLPCNPGGDFFTVNFTADGKFMTELNCVAMRTKTILKGRVVNLIDGGSMITSSSSPKAIHDNLEQMGELMTTSDLVKSKIGRKHTIHIGMNASIGADIQQLHSDMEKKARSGRLTQEDKAKVTHLHGLETGPNGQRQSSMMKASGEMEQFRQDLLSGRESPGSDVSHTVQEAEGLFMDSEPAPVRTPVGRKSSMISTHKYAEPSFSREQSPSIGKQMSNQMEMQRRASLSDKDREAEDKEEEK